MKTTLDSKIFTREMTRLSTTFDPSRFNGEQGQVRSQEYYRVLRQSHPDDLKTAVDVILENWTPTAWERFPVPATILESVRSAATVRRDRDEAMARRQIPETTPEDRERIREIVAQAEKTLRTIQ